MVMKNNMAEITHVDPASSEKTMHYVIDDLRWPERRHEAPEKSKKIRVAKNTDSFAAVYVNVNENGPGWELARKTPNQPTDESLKCRQ